MIEAIALLRRIADECECQARTSNLGQKATQAEMMDIAAKWHWLARTAASLCKRSEELNGTLVGCSSCSEKCLD